MTDILKGVQATDYAAVVNKQMAEEFGGPASAAPVAPITQRAKVHVPDYVFEKPEVSGRLARRRVDLTPTATVEPYIGPMTIAPAHDAPALLGFARSHGIGIIRYGVRPNRGLLRAIRVENKEPMVTDDLDLAAFIDANKRAWMKHLGDFLDNFTLLAFWENFTLYPLAVRQHASDKVFADRGLLNSYAPRHPNVVIDEWLSEAKIDTASSEVLEGTVRVTGPVVVVPTWGISASQWFNLAFAQNITKE